MRPLTSLDFILRKTNQSRSRGGVVWRFKYCDATVIRNMYSPIVRKFNWLIRPIVWRSIVSRFNAMAWAQGTGRHSYDEVNAMMVESGEALSKILGNKKFLLGDEPCEDDAAVFGLLAQGFYASPGAPFHVVFESSTKQLNLVELLQILIYRFRMPKPSSISRKNKEHLLARLEQFVECKLK